MSKKTELRMYGIRSRRRQNRRRQRGGKNRQAERRGFQNAGYQSPKRQLLHLHRTR